MRKPCQPPSSLESLLGLARSLGALGPQCPHLWSGTDSSLEESVAPALGTRQMPQGPSPFLSRCARPAPCPAAPRTLLLPSVQGQHVHGVGDEQQQAQWRPHLGSLVRGRAGVPAPRRRPQGFPGRPDGRAATRRRRGGRGGCSARIRGRGVRPAVRDSPSARGPAARSSEGVGGAGTRPRGEEPARRGRRVNPRGPARRAGVPGQGPGGLPVPQSAVWRRPPPALPCSHSHRQPARHRYRPPGPAPNTQVQKRGRPGTPNLLLSAPPSAPLPAPGFSFSSFRCFSFPLRPYGPLHRFLCFSVFGSVFCSSTRGLFPRPPSGLFPLRPVCFFQEGPKSLLAADPECFRPSLAGAPNL